jgi:trigger factor
VESTVKKHNERVEIAIELTPEEMRRFERRAAKELGRETTIKGFRKGAAPLEVLERQFGKEKIAQEAAELAVRESYVQALVEHEVETIGEPEVQIKSFAPEEPFAFVASAPAVPAFSLPDYTHIDIPAENVLVEDDEVERSIEVLRKSRASYAAVSRPAQKGDRVEIDFSTRKNSVPLEGGTSTQHPLIVGEGHFMKGFEEELVGLRSGEEKEFSLTAPADYYRKDIAGAELTFSVRLRTVQEVLLPEVNDEFARRLGKFNSLSELKESVKEGLTHEREERAKERRRIHIIEWISKRTKLAVPDVLVEQEIEKMEREFSSSLADMNLNVESYLTHIGKSAEELKSEWKTQAERRVKAALLLRKIAQKEGVHVPAEEVDARVNDMLKSVSSPEELKGVNIHALRDHARVMLRNQKVFELLEERVTHT